MIILSFIVPFYNGQEYFAQCIESLYCQNIPQEDYEVIVVDDCSNNEVSLQRLKSCENEHSNMHVIKNSRNLRAGGSRNEGIRHANGKYLWFVDQDDKIEENCLGRILDFLETDQLDYLMFNYANFNEKDNSFEPGVVTVNTEVMSGLEYAHNICKDNIWSNQWTTSAWHQVYRKDFLLEHNALFSEVSFYEEISICTRALMYAQRMRAISNTYYHYRLNENSVIHTEVGTGGRTLYDATIFAGKFLCDLSKEIIDLDETFSHIFSEAGVWRMNAFTKGLLRISPKQKNEFYKQVKLLSGDTPAILPCLTRFNQLLVKCPSLAHILHPFNKLYRAIK